MHAPLLACTRLPTPSPPGMQPPRYLATSSSSVVLDPCNPTNNLARTMNRFAWGLLEKATSETLQSLGVPSRLPGVPVVFTAATVVLVTTSRIPERGLASALAWQACSTPGRSRLQRVCRGVFGGCAAVGSFRIGGESRCDSAAGPYKQSACSPVHTCMHAPPCVCVCVCTSSFLARAFLLARVFCVRAFAHLACTRRPPPPLPLDMQARVLASVRTCTPLHEQTNEQTKEQMNE